MRIEGDYIVVPNGQGNGGSGEAFFSVRAYTDTTVTLQGEVLAQGGKEDSFYVWFDDQSKYTWHTGTKKSFGWVTVGRSFTLSKGTHILHFGNREDGTKLKRLQIASGDATFEGDWSTTTVHKNKRCSIYLWSSNGMSRVAAQDKCVSDPSCKGLMWYNNGGDGRTASSGWYQGCGGNVGSDTNTDWDTLVKPSGV